jgi:hypothetical protein
VCFDYKYFLSVIVLMVLMGLACMTVIVSVLVMQLNSSAHTKPPPAWIMACTRKTTGVGTQNEQNPVVSATGNAVQFGNSIWSYANSDQHITGNDAQNDINMLWKCVAKTVDCVACCVTVSAAVITVGIYGIMVSRA